MIDKMDLSNKASNLRKKLGADGEAPIDIFKLVQKIENLTLVFYGLGKNISGVCYKGTQSSLIVINSDMSLGRQRFSLAHELYHLYYDEVKKSSVSLILIGEGDETERKADQFASYFLISSSSLYRMVEEIRENANRTHLEVEDIIKLGQFYGISHKAMLYRLRNDGYLDAEEIKNMDISVIETASRLGYDTSLYRPLSESKKEMVLGHYIKSTEQLLENNRISQGKYEELLLDAFRYDIVYGLDEEGELSFD